jgi:hypothetical protein
MILATAALLFSASFNAVQAPDRYIEVLSRRFAAWAIQNRRSAYVLLDIVVRPDGSITHCKVEGSYGSQKLAEQACSLVYNILLIPARGPDGTAVYGRTNFDIRFMSQGGREQRDVENMGNPPDLTIDDPGFTPSDGHTPTFQVAVLVQPDGVVRGCQAGNPLMEASDVAAPPPAQLVEQACGQVTGTTRGRIRAPDGTPSAYVDVLDVCVE